MSPHGAQIAQGQQDEWNVRFMIEAKRSADDSISVCMLKQMYTYQIKVSRSFRLPVYTRSQNLIRT